jgi:hypothetical protein
LLFMGAFLRAGFTSTGNNTSIRIMNGWRPVLTLHPRTTEDSIYVMKSYIANEMDIHLAINTIYSINYDIIHRWLVHPSKEVLLKAWKHLKDFPEIEFPMEEHLCPGCAMRKMTNRPFPLSGPLPSQYYTWGYYPDRPSTKTQHESHVGTLRQENRVRCRVKNSRSEITPKQSQYCQHLTWPHTRRDERGGYLERIKLRSTSARN